MSRVVSSLAVAIVLCVPLAGSAAAQPVLGPVTWQLQPYCNILTLTLTSTPAGFTLDGTDDRCGATDKASAVGIASANAAGNFTLNLTIVTPGTAKPVHVSAVVSPANGSGTWTDSLGNTGTFAFLAAVPGLPPRPSPASGLAPASISTVEIAPGAVGASDINTAEVQARVLGTCPAGQSMTGVNANGSVACGPTTGFVTDLHPQVTAVIGTANPAPAPSGYVITADLAVGRYQLLGDLTVRNGDAANTVVVLCGLFVNETEQPTYTLTSVPPVSGGTAGFANLAIANTFVIGTAGPTTVSFRCRRQGATTSMFYWYGNLTLLKVG